MKTVTIILLVVLAAVTILMFAVCAVVSSHKKPRELLPGALSTFFKYCAFFSHPDFTVGSGISPDQPPKRVADYTAGRESHPAPKKFSFL